MKHLMPLILYIFVVISCGEKINRPLPLFPNDTISLPIEGLSFKTNKKGWKAKLYSFTQPFNLITEDREGEMIVFSGQTGGIIEGAGILVLSLGETYFYYDYYFNNSEKLNIEKINYISPTTYNLDSTLIQQKISYKKDQYCNLIYFRESDNLFNEQFLRVPSKIGNYRVTENLPLSTYYVQPGALPSIPLSYSLDRNTGTLKILAGPLTDRFGNKIVDGTVIQFILSDGEKKYIQDMASLDGFSEIKIDSFNKKEISVIAKSNRIISEMMVIKL